MSFESAMNLPEGAGSSNPGTNLLKETQAVRPGYPEDVPEIPGGEFSAVALQLLTKLDTRHSGEITKKQLAKALEDPAFDKSQDAQAISALYRSFGLLHNLSKHEGWLSPASITAGDLDTYAEIQKKQGQRRDDAGDMKDWAQKGFDRFDKDNSGALTREEIASALKDPQTSPADRQMLETVQKHYSEIGHFWEKEITFNDLDNFAQKCLKDTHDAKLVFKIMRTCLKVNMGQKPEISHELYADVKNPLSSITPEAIRQGWIGDCYFESSLASVAKAHPQMIKDAIADNHNGTFTVTFPGDRDNPITIKTPTEAEQGLYNHGSPYGLWASVMEKAYGSYCQQHFWRRNPRNLSGGYTPAEGADGGGRDQSAIRLLTGHSASSNLTTLSLQSTIATKLEKAFSADSPGAVTADIYYGNPFTGLYTADHYHKLHAYSITNFVPDGKGSGMVTIRNPWSLTANTTDGTTTVPLAKLMKNFTNICFEQ